MQQFLRPFDNYEMLLDWAKDIDEEPQLIDIEEKQEEEKSANYKSDLKWFNNQLYSILSLVCTDDALQVVKNLREEGPTRGFRAWYQLTREVAGKSGVRLEKLSDRVHHPKPMKGYHEGLAVLAKWKEDLRELAKIEGQNLSGLTKRTALKSMLPEELQHDLEKDRSLKTFESAWKYAQEQIPIRKDWKKNMRRGKDDMDVDAAEAVEPETHYDGGDGTGGGRGEAGEEGDLNTIKGAGKGQFQGYCGFCYGWGHKRADCRKRMAADSGKGKGDGSTGAWKGGKGDQKGSWDQKGSKGWMVKGGQWNKGKDGGKKGWGKGNSGPKGGGFQGMFYNIDGDSDNTWGTQQESFYNGGRFFGCLLGDEYDESDSGDDVVCLPCEDSDDSELGDDLMMVTDDVRENEWDESDAVKSKPQTYATFADLLEAYRNTESDISPVKAPTVRLPKQKVKGSPRQLFLDNSPLTISTSEGESPIADDSLDSIAYEGSYAIVEGVIIGGDNEVIDVELEEELVIRDVQEVVTSSPGGDNQFQNSSMLMPDAESREV